MEYKAYRIINGKPRWIIVDESGKIANTSPSKGELKELEIEKYKQTRTKKYTDNELIEYIVEFYVENGRVPKAEDFDNNIRLPSLQTYNNHFGSLNKSLEKAGLSIHGGNSKGAYNDTNTCENIKKDGLRCTEKLRPGIARRVYDKEGNWTGQWFCVYCNNSHYQKINPNSTHNIIKSMRDRRLCRQDANHTNVKGDRFQRITTELFAVEDLNIKYDNYICPIDHSRHHTLGVLQTKGRLLQHIEEWWHAKLEKEWNKEFDNLIFYCADKYGERIERIYIIPKDEIVKRTYIRIFKDDSRSKDPWYEKYRIKDEEIIRRTNEIYGKK